MTEQEMMALFNPMKASAAVFVAAWLIVCTLVTNLSKRKTAEDSFGWILGGVFNGLTMFIVTPIFLGFQFGLFFSGMQLYEVHTKIENGNFYGWAGTNLFIGLIILCVYFSLTYDNKDEFEFTFTALSSIPMNFVVAGLLGFLVQNGAIAPDTFYAITLYTKEFALNGFFLVCVIGAIAAIGNVFAR